LITSVVEKSGVTHTFNRNKVQTTLRMEIVRSRKTPSSMEGEGLRIESTMRKGYRVLCITRTAGGRPKCRERSIRGNGPAKEPESRWAGPGQFSNTKGREGGNRLTVDDQLIEEFLRRLPFANWRVKQHGFSSGKHGARESRLNCGPFIGLHRENQSAHCFGQ